LLLPLLLLSLLRPQPQLLLLHLLLILSYLQRKTRKKVKLRLLPKPTQRLLRQLPQPQLSNFCLDDDDDGITIEDLDLQSGYRRDIIIPKKIIEPELNDYIKSRLLLSRYLALRKYNEKWG
jgi:hypothetical protein